MVDWLRWTDADGSQRAQCSEAGCAVWFLAGSLGVSLSHYGKTKELVHGGEFEPSRYSAVISYGVTLIKPVISNVNLKGLFGHKSCSWDIGVSR